MGAFRHSGCPFLCPVLPLGAQARPEERRASRLFQSIDGRIPALYGHHHHIPTFPAAHSGSVPAYCRMPRAVRTPGVRRGVFVGTPIEKRISNTEFECRRAVRLRRIIWGGFGTRPYDSQWILLFL